MLHAQHTGATQRSLTPLFGWDPTGEVAARVGHEIERRLASLPPGANRTVERLVAVAGDVRLVAEYLRAAMSGDASVVDLLEQVAQEPDCVRRGRLRYEVGRTLFGEPGAATPAVTGTRAEILTGSHVTLCAEGEDVRPVLQRLLADLGPGLRSFVENQHEVSSPNARVRQGVVKAWHLPDGTRVASKRRNPLKPERFAREQESWSAVAARIGSEGGRPTPFGERRYVAVVPRLGLVRDQRTDEVYAISRWVDGVSIETLLHELPAGPGRRTVLEGYRALLDFLLDYGVLWGDLSPRNVLVEGSGGQTTYWLVDFEKTTVVDAPVPSAARVEFCRGQVGVEELGVLCSRAELEAVLAGYFAPSSWNLASTAPPSFPARPEVAATLLARSVINPTEGQYHVADLEILDVRSPDHDPITGKRRLVGLVGFRVEHYLSCAHVETADDYDYRTTEILIAARRANCFDAVWRVLDEAAGRLEREFVVSEFLSALTRRGSESLTEVPVPEVRALTSVIDTLYAQRNDPATLRSLAEDLSSGFSS